MITPGVQILLVLAVLLTLLVVIGLAKLGTFLYNFALAVPPEESVPNPLARHLVLHSNSTEFILDTDYDSRKEYTVCDKKYNYVDMSISDPLKGIIRYRNSRVLCATDNRNEASAFLEELRKLPKPLCLNELTKYSLIGSIVLEILNGWIILEPISGFVVSALALVIGVSRVYFVNKRKKNADSTD